MHTWNEIKEFEGRNVQEVEAKHRVKSTVCEGKAAHREYDMTWKIAQMQLSNYFCLQLYTRLLAMQPNTWSYSSEIKASNKKASQRTHEHCFAGLSWQVITIKHTTSKDCWWDYIHINPQKEQALCWACTHVAEANWVLHQGRAHAGQAVTHSEE